MPAAASSSPSCSPSPSFLQRLETASKALEAADDGVWRASRHIALALEATRHFKDDCEMLRSADGAVWDTNKAIIVAKKAIQALQRDVLLGLDLSDGESSAVKRNDREGSEVSQGEEVSKSAPCTPLKSPPRYFSSPITTPFQVTHSTSSPPPWPKSPYIGRFLAIDDTPLLVGNWSGVFYRREVKAGPLKGRKVFKETPIEQVIPADVDVIPFAGLSGDLLVRMAGKESCWLVLPASGSRSEVDEWMDMKERGREKELEN